MRLLDTAVLVAAAGDGTRLGYGPKAFVSVRGRTLLDVTLETLMATVTEVVVALPVQALDVARATSMTSDGLTFVEGGATRQESVERMLAVTGSRTVLVHDVARPFVTRSVIDRVAESAARTGAATAVLAVADTVFDVRLSTSLQRSDLRIVQTPQGFDRLLLEEAHAAARRDGVTATDDADLVRRLGHPVELVEGSRLLHKVTGPQDLAMTEALYDAWLRESVGRSERG